MAKIELGYIEVNGLLYPDIETGMENIENSLGKYGILRLRYLHEHKHELYRELLLTGNLVQHCNFIDKAVLSYQSRYRKCGLKPTSVP